MSHFLPSSPQLMLLAAMAILIWALWRRSNKHFGRGGKAYEPTHRISKLKEDRDLALSDAPADVTRWQVEMHDLCREMKGELDTKMAVLQVLIRQASEATARLEAATKRAARMGLDRLANPLDAIEAWEPEAAESSACDVNVHPLAAQISVLAKAGASAQAIAEQTGLPIGEVEMALSLRESV